MEVTLAGLYIHPEQRARSHFQISSALALRYRRWHGNFQVTKINPTQSLINTHNFGKVWVKAESSPVPVVTVVLCFLLLMNSCSHKWCGKISYFGWNNCIAFRKRMYWLINLWSKFHVHCLKILLMLKGSCEEQLSARLWQGNKISREHVRNQNRGRRFSECFYSVL